MKKLILIVVLIGLALSFSGGLALAHSGDDQGEHHDVAGSPFEKQTVPELSEQGIYDTLTSAADWVFTILVIFSVFIILMSAFQFVTGGPEGVSEARQKLIWAAVGIALALLAKGIPLLIVNIAA